MKFINDHNYHWDGVAIFVDKITQQYVTNLPPVFDKVIEIQLQKKQRAKINIIQVYEPKIYKIACEFENFFINMKWALEIARSKDATTIVLKLERVGKEFFDFDTKNI